ncbi:unnamed protein product [Boreogadus saida]
MLFTLVNSRAKMFADSLPEGFQSPIEVETFVCILGEEDVVYDVYVAAAAIDIRPTTKGTVGSGNATSELSWAIPPPPYRTFAIRSVPHPAVETRH